MVGEEKIENKCNLWEKIGYTWGLNLKLVTELNVLVQVQKQAWHILSHDGFRKWIKVPLWGHSAGVGLWDLTLVM